MSGSEDLWEIIGQSGASPICAFDKDCRLIAFNRAHSDEFFRIYAYRVQIGDIFPDLFLIVGSHVMDLSGVQSVDHALGQVGTDLAGVKPDEPIVVLGTRGARGLSG